LSPHPAEPQNPENTQNYRGKIRPFLLTLCQEFWTQECLSELSGVHVQTIGALEHGNFPFAVTTFARISQFLEVSPNRLLDGLRLPDPERTARIKKALARKRAPRKTK